MKNTDCNGWEIAHHENIPDWNNLIPKTVADGDGFNAPVGKVKNVSDENVYALGVPDRNALFSRRRILTGGVVALAASATGASARPKSLPDGNSFAAAGDDHYGKMFSAEDRFSHHLGYAAMALAELRGDGKGILADDLVTLGRFLRAALPTERADYHAVQLAEAMGEMRPGGQWMIRVRPDIGAAVIVQVGDTGQ